MKNSSFKGVINLRLCVLGLGGYLGMLLVDFHVEYKTYFKNIIKMCQCEAYMCIYVTYIHNL